PVPAARAGQLHFPVGPPYAQPSSRPARPGRRTASPAAPRRRPRHARRDGIVPVGAAALRGSGPVRLWGPGAERPRPRRRTGPRPARVVDVADRRRRAVSRRPARVRGVPPVHVRGGDALLARYALAADAPRAAPRRALVGLETDPGGPSKGE